MPSILAIAAARWSPRASADGSLNDVLSAEAGGAVEAGAGEGVAGGFVVEEVVVGAGAAGGAAGVDVDCAGGAGSAGFGAGLGFGGMETMKPFSSILYD